MRPEMRPKLVRFLKELNEEEREELLLILQESIELGGMHALIGSVNSYSNDYREYNQIDNIAKIVEEQKT
jgi:hypothetical protein